MSETEEQYLFNNEYEYLSTPRFKVGYKIYLPIISVNRFNEIKNSLIFTITDIESKKDNNGSFFHNYTLNSSEYEMFLDEESLVSINNDYYYENKKINLDNNQ